MVQIKADKSKKKPAMKAMEMEPMVVSETNGDSQQHEESSSSPAREPLNPVLFVVNLWALIVVYASYYRSIAAPVGVLLVIIFVTLSLEHIAKVSAGHHKISMKHDYATVYNSDLKLSDVDHWCLQGDNDSCSCDDVSEGITNEQVSGWVKAFKANKELASEPDTSDVVFVGDGPVEAWNDRSLAEPLKRLKGLHKYWNTKFDKDEGAQFDAIALGIDGDTIPNVLWRLEHGEMPVKSPKIFWLVVGGNDLRVGQCSEEVVVLGILRLAEFLHHKYAGVYVVINSILPQQTSVKTKHGKFDIWPSIRSVNEQLEAFCEHHRYFHFYDATSLFMKKPKSTKAEIIESHMDKDKIHVSMRGHKVWIDGILDFVAQLVFDTDYSDDAAGDEIDE